jgi:hypothetical protein
MRLIYPARIQTQTELTNPPLGANHSTGCLWGTANTISVKSFALLGDWELDFGGTFVLTNYCSREAPQFQRNYQRGDGPSRPSWAHWNWWSARYHRGKTLAVPRAAPTKRARTILPHGPCSQPLLCAGLGRHARVPRVRRTGKGCGVKSVLTPITKTRYKENRLELDFWMCVVF